MQIGLLRGMESGAERVVRPGPAFLVVVEIAQNIEMFLPARRAGIKGPAAGELQPWNYKMQFMVVGMTVAHPKDIALVRLHAGEGHLFKIVHHPSLLLRRHDIIRVPGQNSGREFPFGVQAVDEGAGQLNLAAQHFRGACVSPRIIRPNQIVGRPLAVALAMRENFHIHWPPRESSGKSPRKSRSILMRAISTSRASTLFL